MVFFEFRFVKRVQISKKTLASSKKETKDLKNLCGTTLIEAKMPPLCFYLSVKPSVITGTSVRFYTTHPASSGDSSGRSFVCWKYRLASTADFLKDPCRLLIPFKAFKEICTDYIIKDIFCQEKMKFFSSKLNIYTISTILATKYP